jgi:hypothetical protein
MRHTTGNRYLPRVPNIWKGNTVTESSERARQKQAAVGLPAEPIYDWQMSFLPRSRAVLLRFSTIQSEIRIPRLFVRKEGSNQYVDMLDIVGPALTATPRVHDPEVFPGVQASIVGPNDVLYFLLCEYRKVQGRRSGSTLSIIRVDFLSNSTESQTPNDCSPEACSVVDLVGVDNEGVYANAGFKRLIEGEPGSYSVEYFLAHLHWADWRVTRILPLPDIYY